MLDETMHKFTASFFVSGGDTNGKGDIMVGSVNKPGPTFNGGEAGVSSTIVLVTRMMLVVVVVWITLASAVNPCRSW